MVLILFLANNELATYNLPNQYLDTFKSDMIGKILDRRWPLDEAPGAQDEEWLQERQGQRNPPLNPEIEDSPNGAV